MHNSTRSLCALMLVLVCLPLFASSDCPGIRALNANDVQTGERVTITWSYSNGTVQSQTLSGHDFAAPVQLAPGQTSYTYTASMPGEKHVTLAAVTACGTFTQSATYHVKECAVVPPEMTLSKTSVAPGDTLQAAVALLPGHTARWEVTNGTASATTGSAITVTAGRAGTMTVTAFVSRGSSCSVPVAQNVQIVENCSIVEPEMYTPETATADQWFYIILPGFEDPASPLKATFNVTNGTDVYADLGFVSFLAPSQGSFTVDIAVSDGTCSRTFSKSWTVTACTASAVVTPGQQGECGYTTAVAEFTGVPPFQGAWSDGEYFFTYDTRIERAIAGGDYSINWIYDRYCMGTVSGSVSGGVNLFAPWVKIDNYWVDACPGEVRTARIDYPAVGPTIEWRVTNGTVVSGQGTAEMQFKPDGAGTTEVAARYVDGCPGPWSTNEAQVRVAGKPEFTISVEPSVIPEGGTATITINFTTPAFYAGRMSWMNSLGDTMRMGIGNTITYQSSNGGGTSTITITASNDCGESTTHTATLTIEPAVTGPTAKVSAFSANCDYFAQASFKGTAPFSGTWSNGETFATDNPFVLLTVIEPGTYTLTSFSDATGPGTITGSATFDFTSLPQPTFMLDTTSVCPNGIVTATLTSPLPPGATVQWTGNGEIISGQGTPTAQIRAQWNGAVDVKIVSPDACSPHSESQTVWLKTAQIPYFTVYGVYEGGSTTFEVHLDPDTATWGFENSLGDLLEIVESPQPNVYVLRYTSTHGLGTSTIRVYGTTTCGESFEWSQTIGIFPQPPTVALTYTANPNCGNDVTATFTGGTTPFTGYWSDGTPFTTETRTITRHFDNVTGWINLQASDAAGYPIYSDYLNVPTTYQYYPVSGPGWLCEGSTGTVTADLPEGWTVTWDAWNGARVVSGQGTNTVTIEALNETERSAWVNATFRTPEGCVLQGGTSVWIFEADVANPVITIPTTTIKAGETLDFHVLFPNTAYEYFRFDASNGDYIEHLSQTGFDFGVRYHSVAGPGTSTIKVYAQTMCGKYLESTVTLNITE